MGLFRNGEPVPESKRMVGRAHVLFHKKERYNSDATTLHHVP